MSEAKWPVCGNSRTIRYLSSQLSSKQLSAAYVFVGPGAVGKRTTARFFLQTLLCQNTTKELPCGTCLSCVAWIRSMHPDAFLLENGNGSIDDIRLLKRHLSLRPSLSTSRAGLILETESLSNEAKNGLLKLLEEPPAQTVIILCATSIEYLPLTLRSRCHVVMFDLIPKQLIIDMLRERTSDEGTLREISALSAGRPGLANTFLEHPDELQLYYQRIQFLLDALERPLAERLAVQPPFAKQPFASAKASLQTLLDLFLWLYRDIVLVQNHNNDAVLHVRFRDRLERLAERMTPVQVLASLKRILRAKGLLAQNVSPSALFDYSLLSP